LESLLGDAGVRDERSRAGIRVAAAERGSAVRAVAELVGRGLWPPS